MVVVVCCVLCKWMGEGGGSGTEGMPRGDGLLRRLPKAVCQQGDSLVTLLSRNVISCGFVGPSFD